VRKDEERVKLADGRRKKQLNKISNNYQQKLLGSHYWASLLVRGENAIGLVSKTDLFLFIPHHTHSNRMLITLLLSSSRAGPMAGTLFEHGSEAGPIPGTLSEGSARAGPILGAFYFELSESFYLSWT